MKKLALALLAASTLSTPAFAENANFPKAGDWLVRARIIGILPDEDSRITPIGGAADFSDEVTPEVDFSYFFTENWAAELVLATAKHHADVKGSTAGAQVDVGSAWVVPPTLTLQYHFTNFEAFKPYVGAGLNYTMYFNEDPGSQTSLDLKNSFGYAFQAGVDVPLNARWGVNFDVKKIFTGADGVWNGGGIRADIDLDPWVVGVGVSYRF